MMHELLHQPTRPIQVQPGTGVADLLEQMAGTAFQARNLARAFRAWLEMLSEPRTVFLGLAGAMVPAGMRRVLVFLIQHRFVDVVVSTGANLFHDLHETFGGHHYQGHPDLDDEVLAEAMIDRMYDVLASEREFREVDRFVAEFAKGLDSRPHTTREFFYRLGMAAADRAREEGIVVTAAQAKVPVYAPAIGDSSYGIALAYGREHLGVKLQIDIVGDVWETAELAARAPSTGIVILGGGTPKNFIQQTEVTADLLGRDVRGHDYAVQFTQDAPHWGGLSGATFEEARSWGKMSPEARKVQVFADATICLPLVATGLAERLGVPPKRPAVPQFKLDGQVIEIEP